MTLFTEEEMRRLGEEYLKEHPELAERYKAEKERLQAAQPAQEAAVEPATEEVAPEATEAKAEDTADPDELIAIVYPVSWPPASEDLPHPHSTLIFLGPVAEAKFTRDDLKAALKTFMWEPFDVAIGQVEMFGPEDDQVPVVTLLGQVLIENRQALEAELKERGIEDASEYPYNPHITVDAASMHSVPFMSVRLGQPQIWWGAERG